MLPGGHRFIPLVRIAELELEVRRQIDGHEARRQIAGANVGHVRLRRIARRRMSVGVDVAPAHRREAVIGGHEQIGRRGERGVALQRRQDLAQSVIGVMNRGLRRRAIDARGEVVQAVALIVLGGVRIARPEHQHERLSALFEFGEDHPGDGDGQELLLPNLASRVPASGCRPSSRCRPGSSACRWSAPAASQLPSALFGAQRSPDRAARLSGTGPVVDEDGRRHRKRTARACATSWIKVGPSFRSPRC